ncbi:hypothetical protein BJ138DRAFT_1151528 [Hygrophoropsis aurantiaca]|uniref:Uncharacterized protein n=1 Tax=Hygrophoropsis aurantiaca TaxID=72124 RepID=A0ACB8ACV6_9AGAM|nr:hypothetical protein BJ138DRAFT_1151528 [Hygrophoropsis aurantiaca]
MIPLFLASAACLVAATNYKLRLHTGAGGKGEMEYYSAKLSTVAWGPNKCGPCGDHGNGSKKNHTTPMRNHLHSFRFETLNTDEKALPFLRFYSHPGCIGGYAPALLGKKFVLENVPDEIVGADSHKVCVWDSD